MLYYVYIGGLGLREIDGDGAEEMTPMLAAMNTGDIFFETDMHLPEYREPFTINKIA